MRSVEKLINNQNYNISNGYIDTNLEKNEENNQFTNNTNQNIEKQIITDRPINIKKNIDDNNLFLDKILLSKCWVY